MPIRQEKVVFLAEHDGKEFADEGECLKYERVYELTELFDSDQDIDPHEPDLRKVAECVVGHYGLLKPEQIKMLTERLDQLLAIVEPLVGGQEVSIERARTLKRTLAEVDCIVRNC